MTNTTDFIIIEYNLSIKGEVSNMTTNKIKTHDFPVVALINKIKDWHQNRNLIEGSTDKDQVLKLQQELGELSDSVCKQKDMKDDLGDMMVIMLNIMKRNNYTMEECLETAYNDIKDRKGKMDNGTFKKD